MSSPLTTQLPTDVATSPSSTNLASNPSSSQPAPSSSLSPTAGQALPPDSQELSYFSSNPIEYSQPNDGPSTSTGRPTGGRCYSRDELFHLKKSPLVAPPPGMPHRKDWFGEFNEQASKPKDHDGLAATRMRHRRDADPEDPTRSFDSTRSQFRSSLPQPSGMGSFRHQSFRDRDIDKDTASLKSIAERYDREKLGPLSPGIAGFTGRVKDREAAPHFNGKDTTSRFAAKDRESDPAVPRIGAVPTRRAEGGREPRKKGDDVGDWRRNADPARERTETRDRDGKRETSRTGGGDEDRRRRDRSRAPGEEEGRRWREDGTTKERKGRDPSRNGDRRSRERGQEREVNGRSGKKKTEEEEQAEANRRRKEERDKETPAWFDEDATPSSNGLKGFAGSGGALDELQKWKLEKKAREEEKAREEREAANPSSNSNVTSNDVVEHRDQEATDTTIDEHKTPRPAKVQVDWAAAPPPPQPPVLFQTQGPTPSQTSSNANESLPTANPLDALKAMMGVTKDDAPPMNVNGPPGINGSNTFSSATSSPLSSNYSPAVSRPPQSASAINYEAVGKAGTSDFDPPAVSRHAFAQPRGIADPSPAPSDNTKPFDAISAMGNGVGQPAGLRTIQSAEPSHRTRNLGSVHGQGHQPVPGPGSRSSRDSSPSHVDTSGPFVARQPPPHLLAGIMNQSAGANMNTHPGLHSSALPNLGSAAPMAMNTNVLEPLFHLPASAGPGAGPKDGSMNALSVIAPQAQQQQMTMNMGMGGGNGMGMSGIPAQTQNASPQQNLLTRLGILQHERKPSPKIMDGAAGVGVGGTDLRMPMPQQHYGNGPPSASSASALSMGRGVYGSPVDERFEPPSAVSGDGRFGMNQNQSQHQPGSSSSSNYGPSPVGNANPNPAHTLSAKGSRLAKFFENPRDDGVSSPHGHAGAGTGMNLGGMGMMGPGGIQGRRDLITPPSQFDGDKGQGGMSDLLALLQSSNLHASQQPNRVNNGVQQQMYRDEMLLRQRELVLQQQQQQQLREREARQLEQQMYGQNADFFDSRGSFVSNDLVPGLRPPIQRAERDLYNSDRLDDRLAYAAHGRLPGVPGGYDQMMRNMGINQPARAAGAMNGANMYSGAAGMSPHLTAEILQQQQQQQQMRERERQRQLQLQQRQQEIERAQLIAMQAQAQGAPLSARSSSSNLSAQLGPRQGNLDQYNRAGRLGVNDVQPQQFGGYGGPNVGSVGGMGLNGGFGMGNQLNGFDAPLRQQQIGVQQQRQVPGMGFGGVDGRYGQQNQLHGAVGGMNQGGAQPPDLMALLLAGNRGGQPN